MSSIAIRTENLGKRYRIGRRERYRTLRDAMTAAVYAPFQSVAAALNGGRLAARDAAEDHIWALKDVSFEVKRGEVVGLIGRNGAGKTTLLKILSRITEPTEGYAEIYGQLGSLLEVGTGFHPELTGRENIYLNGAILGMKKKEINRRFDEIVSFAEMEKFIDTPVKRYSSGMHMRLAFAVAAHLEPDILLVDEVLAVGDAGFQKKCLGKMGEVASEGRTVLFVSHQMFAVRTLCERVVWLEGGRLVKCGPSSEVVREYEETELERSSPSSPVVERFRKDAKEPGFYISRVEIRNARNEITQIYSYNDSLTLIMDLSGECPSDNYSVEFRVYKDSGEFACVGASGVLHGIYFDKGTRRVKIDIGPLILTNGGYTVSLRLMIGTSVVDNWDRACSFHIVECRPFAVPREIKVPVCVIQHRFSSVEGFRSSDG